MNTNSLHTALLFFLREQALDPLWNTTLRQVINHG